MAEAPDPNTFYPSRTLNRTIKLSTASFKNPGHVQIDTPLGTPPPVNHLQFYQKHRNPNYSEMNYTAFDRTIRIEKGLPIDNECSTIKKRNTSSKKRRYEPQVDYSNWHIINI